MDCVYGMDMEEKKKLARNDETNRGTEKKMK